MRHIRSSDIRIAVGIFTFFGIVFFVIKGRDGGDKKEHPPALAVPITTTELEMEGRQSIPIKGTDEQNTTTEVERAPSVSGLSSHQVESILFTDFDRGTPP